MNVASAALTYSFPALAGPVSMGSYGLLLLYYFLKKKKSYLNKWMISLGVLYFGISAFQYSGLNIWFLFNAIKYFIVIICGYELIKNVSSTELFLVFLAGSLTILLHATVIGAEGSGKYGRFSGFYINPNAAGFICSSGYALSYAIKNRRFRLTGQIILTAMGLLTLSRTFIATWVLVNLISIFIDVKNIKIFGYGFLLLIGLLFISEFLPVKNERIEQLKSFTDSEKQVAKSEEVLDDSRSATWSKYYSDIAENLFLGNGYDAFNITEPLKHRHGVHNTFLLVLGEGGVLPFLVISVFYIYLFVSSVQLFSIAPNLMLQTFVLLLFLMAAHVYFTHHYILFISMWIQYRIESKKKALNEKNLVKN